MIKISSIYKPPVALFRKGLFYLIRRLTDNQSRVSAFFDKEPVPPLTFNDYHKRSPRPNKFSVLFYSDFEDDHMGNRYRVNNLIEQLNTLKIETDQLHRIDKPQDWDKIASFDILVIYRTRNTPIVKRLIEFAKKLNMIAVYSIDDFVFDTSVLERISGFLDLGSRDKEIFTEVVDGQRKALLSCKYLIVTNESLKKNGDELGKKTFIIRNGVNHTQLKASKKGLDERKEGSNIFLGYFSGTKTHGNDFQVITEPLLRILEEFSQVNLFIVGPLDLGEKLAKYEDRILREHLVHWTKLPNEIAKVDINLVPFELPNPFIDCKSELKYFEAALLKIPTIASPAASFKYAINQGVNGYLAKSSKEWYLFMKKLILDKNLRKRIGEAAYKHTIKTYTPESQAKSTYKVFEDIVRDYLNEKNA